MIDGPDNPLHRERWRKLRASYKPYRAVRTEPEDRMTWKRKVRSEHFINGKHAGHSLADITLPRIRRSLEEDDK